MRRRWAYDQSELKEARGDAPSTYFTANPKRCGSQLIHGLDGLASPPDVVVNGRFGLGLVAGEHG